MNTGMPDLLYYASIKVLIKRTLSQCKILLDTKIKKFRKKWKISSPKWRLWKFFFDDFWIQNNDRTWFYTVLLRSWEFGLHLLKILNDSLDVGTEHNLLKARFPNLGNINILSQIIVIGGCPVHFRMFSSTPGLYLLDVSSTSSSGCDIQNRPVKCLLEGKTTSVWETLV